MMAAERDKARELGQVFSHGGVRKGIVPSGARKFSQDCAERFGCSESQVRRYMSYHDRIIPEVRGLLAGTPVERNGVALDRIARCLPKEQLREALTLLPGKKRGIKAPEADDVVMPLKMSRRHPTFRDRAVVAFISRHYDEMTGGQLREAVRKAFPDKEMPTHSAWGRYLQAIGKRGRVTTYGMTSEMQRLVREDFRFCTLDELLRMLEQKFPAHTLPSRSSLGRFVKRLNDGLIA